MLTFSQWRQLASLPDMAHPDTAGGQMAVQHHRVDLDSVTRQVLRHERCMIRPSLGEDRPQWWYAAEKPAKMIKLKAILPFEQDLDQISDLFKAKPFVPV